MELAGSVLVEMKYLTAVSFATIRRALLATMIDCRALSCSVQRLGDGLRA